MKAGWCGHVSHACCAPALDLLELSSALGIRATSSNRTPQRPEGVANLPAEDLRLLPRCEVTARLGLMEVDQLVVGLLGPAPGRDEALARKRRHRGWDRDV